MRYCEVIFVSKINVEGSEISIIAIDNRDYISLTDMVRNVENGVALIEKWLRNKNTIEFLGIWEEMYNANFNSTEFEGINSFLVGSSKLLLEHGVTRQT